jgi:hypothetical protein
MPRDSSNDENLRVSYQTLCTSYNAIDTFRHQLLGFLPLSSGGIFVLLTNNANPDILKNTNPSLPISIFGFFITVGLYIFEIYGTRRCTHLILLGRHLEEKLDVEGQFKNRPRGLQWSSQKSKVPIAALINEPMAAGVIYPTVGAAWLFLGSKSLELAILVFCIGFFLSCVYNHFLQAKDWREKENEFKGKEKEKESNPSNAGGETCP